MNEHLKLPTTLEEVAKAESEMDESSVILPESLRDPMAILDRHEKDTGKPNFNFNKLFEVIYEEEDDSIAEERLGAELGKLFKAVIDCKKNISSVHN